MDIDLSFIWLTLLLLGAFHGINPGMGWLFAVALGLQERRRAAVWGALLPLALGHALAVGCAVLLAGVIGLVLPLTYLKWIVAGVLLVLGLLHLIRHRHPRFGGMQVGFRDLTVWSFLMASAHGAGLMVLPVLFGAPAGHPVPPPDGALHTTMPVHEPALHDHGAMAAVHGGAHGDHLTTLLAGLPADPVAGLLAMLVHTIGYLLVIGVVAVVVYEKLGLRLLRTAWVNLDLIWAAALVLTAVVTLLL